MEKNNNSNAKNYESSELYILWPSRVISDCVEYEFRDALDSVMGATYPVSKERVKEAKKAGVELKRTSILSNLNYYLKTRKYKLIKSNNENNTIHTVEFENNSEDIIIAERYTSLSYKDILTGEIICSGIESNYCEQEKYIDVRMYDSMSLLQYLWEDKFPNEIYDEDTKNFMLFIKPYHTFEEISLILSKIKGEIVYNNEKPVRFKVKRKTKQPIFTSRGLGE